MSELRNYLTKENVTPDGILQLLGGYDWVEMCLNPDEIYVAHEQEIELYQGLKIVLTRGEYRYKYVVEVIYMGDYFRVGRYRLQMTKYHRSIYRYNQYDNINEYKLGNSFPDKQSGRCAWIGICETTEQFITNFQEITNTTLFM
jgi:hypothetical protein